MTAVARAYLDSVPLLVIASAPVRASFTKQWGVLHELYDQAALAAGVFGIARSAGSAADVRDRPAAVPGLAAHGPTASGVSGFRWTCWPSRLTLRRSVSRMHRLLPRRRTPAKSMPRAFARGAARPLIVAGGGARRAGAQLRRLVEWLDCPLVTTAAGKGVLPESHPANFGTSLPYAPIQQLIFDADVVIAVGTEMGETDVYTALRLPLGALIRVDVGR